MTNKTLEKAQEFLSALNVQEKILAYALERQEISAVLHQLFENKARIDRQKVEKGILKSDLTSVAINYFITDLLTYWNDSISVHTELFWLELEKCNISYDRKDPLKYALTKGHFYNVHQGMHARHNWDRLIATDLLSKRYTNEDIHTLSNIIHEDEMSRVALLKKCLKNKKVSSSDYLRFGDSIAYFTYGQLFKGGETYTALLDQHFTKQEIATLQDIWH